MFRSMPHAKKRVQQRFRLLRNHESRGCVLSDKPEVQGKKDGIEAMTSPVTMPQMTPEQQATYNLYYPSTQRDELVGVLLAVLLGSFGAHHFYLRRNGLGVLYLVFFWTGIPAILGIIEAFFMPGRVRRFNAEQAALLAQSVVQGTMPPPPPNTMAACPACGTVQTPGRYCVHCGREMA